MEKAKIARIVHTCGLVYCYLALGVIALGYLCILIIQGWWKFVEIASPWNMWNNIAIILAFSPGLFLLWLAEKIGK